MKHRLFTACGLLAWLLFALAPAAAPAADSAPAAGAPQRAVFQVNEDDSRKWNTVLANINNVQEELGKVEITVVAIGPGLGMLKADALAANQVLDAMAAGVRFVACGNTMKSLNLGKDDMIDGIAYAKAGYVEVMRLQQQGYAYIRP
ncbi:MAG: DsrE family protein [Betaproteobacteria bacterium]|nr:DsrE family protein [Betaproteobacteria bacterium]